MSQHISGDIGQQVSVEHGEFITIGSLRIRKALVGAYVPYPHKPEGTDEVQHNLHIGYAGCSQMFFVKYASEAECVEALQRLDWIFQKQYGSPKE